MLGTEGDIAKDNRARIEARNRTAGHNKSLSWQHIPSPAYKTSRTERPIESSMLSPPQPSQNSQHHPGATVLAGKPQLLPRASAPTVPIKALQHHYIGHSAAPPAPLASRRHDAEVCARWCWASFTARGRQTDRAFHYYNRVVNHCVRHLQRRRRQQPANRQTTALPPLLLPTDNRRYRRRRCRCRC